nr:MAG TPA: ASCH domain protein [Caudoviricetes sp.]
MKRLKFKDLDNAHAWFEVYRHVDLLKHELQCIYPDIGNNTVLFQIIFERSLPPL